MSKKLFGGLQIRDAQEIAFFDSDSSNFTALKAPAALTGDVTFTLPDGDSTGSQALTSDGSGNLSWVSYLGSSLTNANILVGSAGNVATGVAMSGDIGIIADGTTAIQSGVVVNDDISLTAAISFSKMENLAVNRALVSDGTGDVSESVTTNTEIGYVSGVTSSIQTQINGKASLALDNLASVAINTSLVSDTDNTDDLGSGASSWANGYINTLHLDSNSETTIIQGSASATESVTYSLPPAAPAVNGYILSGQTDGTTAWVEDSGVNSFSADWITADGTTKVINHALGTKDVIVQIYDKSDDETILVDSEVRTDSNNITLTASSAPGASGFRVLILAL